MLAFQPYKSTIKPLLSTLKTQIFHNPSREGFVLFDFGEEFFQKSPDSFRVVLRERGDKQRDNKPLRLQNELRCRIAVFDKERFERHERMKFLFDPESAVGKFVVYEPRLLQGAQKKQDRKSTR